MGIEVLGTPIGTHAYIKDFVTQNCIKIMWDVEKLEPLTDCFTYFQLVQKTMNTRTQYMSANITFPPQEQFLTTQHIYVDRAIAKAILQKGTRGSFHHWVRDEYDLAVTMLQKPHALGGFGLTPNVLAQISAKVVMASRFLKLSSISTIVMYRKCTRWRTILLPLMTLSYYLLLIAFTRIMCEIRSCLSRGILGWSSHLVNVQFLSR